MSNLSKLERIVELLAEQRKDEAEALLHEWIVEKGREIHSRLIEEDESMDSDSHEEVDVESLEDKIENLRHELHDEMENLKAELEELLADEEDYDEEENCPAEDYSDVDAMADEVADEEGEEDYSDVDATADEMTDEEGKEEVEVSDEEEKVEEATETDEDEIDEILKTIEKELNEKDEEMYDSHDEVDSSELSPEELETFLKELDLDDLEEAYEQTTVKFHSSEGEVGAGKKNAVGNTKSPIPQYDTKERMERVQHGIKYKQDSHVGFDREPAPKVEVFNTAKKSKSVVKGAGDFYKPTKGNPDALLNKFEGGNKLSPFSKTGEKE